MYNFLTKNKTLFLIIPILLLSISTPFITLDNTWEKNSGEQNATKPILEKQASNLDVSLETGSEIAFIGESREIAIIVDNLANVVNVTIEVEIVNSFENFTGNFYEDEIFYSNNVFNLSDIFIDTFIYNFTYIGECEFYLSVYDSDDYIWYDYTYFEVYCEYDEYVDISLGVNSELYVGENTTISYNIYNDWSQTLYFDIYIRWDYDAWNDTSKEYDTIVELLLFENNVEMSGHSSYSSDLSVFISEKSFYCFDLIVVDSNVSSMIWSRGRSEESMFLYENSVKLILDFDNNIVVGDNVTFTSTFDNQWYEALNVTYMLIIYYELWNDTSSSWDNYNEFILNETNIIVSSYSNHSIDIDYVFNNRTEYTVYFYVFDENNAHWLIEDYILPKYEHEDHIYPEITLGSAFVNENLSITIDVTNNWTESITVDIELWVSFEIWFEPLETYFNIDQIIFNQTNVQINTSTVFNQIVLFNTTNRINYEFQLKVFDRNNSISWTDQSYTTAKYVFEDYIDIWMNTNTTEYYVGDTVTFDLNILNHWNETVILESVKLYVGYYIDGTHYEELLFNGTNITVDSSTQFTENVNFTLSNRIRYYFHFEVDKADGGFDREPIWYVDINLDPQFEYENSIDIWLDYDQQIVTNISTNLIINIENNWSSDLIVSYELWFGEKYPNSFFYFFWDVNWYLKYHEVFNTSVTSMTTLLDTLSITFEEHGQYGIQLKVTTADGAEWETEIWFEVRDAYEYGVFAWFEYDFSINVGEETSFIVKLDNLGEPIVVNVVLEILGFYHNSSTKESESLNLVLFNQSDIILDGYQVLTVNYTFQYHGMFSGYLTVTDEKGAIWQDTNFIIIDYLKDDKIVVELETEDTIIAGEPTLINFNITNLIDPFTVSIEILDSSDYHESTIYERSNVLLDGFSNASFFVTFEYNGHHSLEFYIFDDYGCIRYFYYQFEVSTEYYLNISVDYDAEITVGDEIDFQIELTGNLTENIEIIILIMDDLYFVFIDESDVDYHREIIFDGSFEDIFTYKFENGGEYLIYVVVRDARDEIWNNGFQIIKVNYSDPPTNDAPFVNIIQPNGGEVIINPTNITWIGSDLNGDSLTFNLYYWNNTDWVEIATYLTTTSFVWDTTVLTSGDFYKIKITVMDGTYYSIDISDASFSINNSINYAPEVSIIYPIGEEVVNGILTIIWTASDPNEDNLTFSIYYWNSTEWILIETDLTNTSYNWDTTTVVDGEFYKISVHASDGNLASTAQSNNEFTIKNTEESETSSQSDTSSSKISQPTPGFEVFILIVSLLSLSRILRRRRN